MIDVVVALTRRPATAILSRSILVPFPENTPLRIKLLVSSSSSSLSLPLSLSLSDTSCRQPTMIFLRVYGVGDVSIGWMESVSTALHAAYKANLHLRRRYEFLEESCAHFTPLTAGFDV